MGNVAVWSAFEFVGNEGGSEHHGSPDIPLIVDQIQGQKYANQALSLAQNTAYTLWTTAVGPTRFNFAYIVSDVGDDSNGLVMVELLTDLDASIGTEAYTVALKAGLPFCLCSDRSYANYTAAFAGGTLDYIQSIKCKNLNTSAANVQLWLVY